MIVVFLGEVLVLLKFVLFKIELGWVIGVIGLFGVGKLIVVKVVIGLW